MHPDTRPWIDTIAKIVLPVLLFVFGFFLVDRVETALKERQLEVQSASAIKDLLNTLHSEAGQSEATSAALTLAAYGEVAVIPLIGTIEYGPPQSAAAARRALFLIGLDHPKELTKTLSRVLAKRDRQFHAKVHQIVIAVLGEVGHPDAVYPLQSYRLVIERPADEGLEDWKSMVQGANVERYTNTQDAVSGALAALGVEWIPPE